MADEELCIPTNQVPLLPELNSDDTFLINRGGPVTGTTAQVPASILASNPPSILVYTSSGTFDRDDYPGLRAARLRVVGGGGAGGGAVATGAGEASTGGGGGGGGYAERIVLLGDLSPSEIVTVGSGGAGSSGADGQNGGDSSFGALAVASGGLGGGVSTSSSTGGDATGGDGGTGVVGDILVAGSFGQLSLILGGRSYRTGVGGGTVLGGSRSPSSAGSANGLPGVSYGGGGSGASNGASQGAKLGGNGAAGVVIVEIYA